MQKNIIIYLTIFLTTIIVFAGNVYADTPTPTTSTSLLEKVANEIASKTAQLNLVEKRGIIGTVTDSSGTQITLSDINGNIRFVDVDELTKFSSSSSSSYGLSDVTKGTILGVLGLYNKQSRRILAREITVESSFPNIIYGTISNIDKTNYEISIVKQNKQTVVIEIQDVTKTSAFSSGNLNKSGFSKALNSETIIAIGFPDKQDSGKILVTNIVLLPDIQTNFSAGLQPAAGSPTIPPSTGSGMKLFPIGK
jgi:hypothetical protein